MKKCRLCDSTNIMIDEEDGYEDRYLGDPDRGYGPHVVVYYHTCEECGYTEQSLR